MNPLDRPNLKDQLYESMSRLTQLEKSKKQMTAEINEEIKGEKDTIRQILRAIEEGENQMHLSEAREVMPTAATRH